jgi:hypothetical protein
MKHVKGPDFPTGCADSRVSGAVTIPRPAAVI